MLHFGYDSDNNANVLSRVGYLADDDGHGNPSTRLAAYQYLGLGSVVRVDCQRPVNGMRRSAMTWPWAAAAISTRAWTSSIACSS